MGIVIFITTVSLFHFFRNSQHPIFSIILCFYSKNINEKVGEVGISYVFSLKHQVDTIFKKKQ